MWFASDQELLAALQETCNNIEGAAKMAFPDPVNVGYCQSFLVKQENEHLRDATPSPALVAILGDNRSMLFVESIGSEQPQQPLSQQKHHRHPDSDNDSSDSYTSNVQSKKFKPLEHVKHCPPAVEGHNKTVQNAREAIEKELKWLLSKVAECNGYHEFAANQQCKQQNVGVVQSWKFIASFSHDFFKKSYGVAVKVSGKQVLSLPLCLCG
ncbi:hypothetical protein L208DRAFT_1378558 [Tricholoma matsutake]|nr:hypothetical protein L208DRAFT_1378558 [Tricholoma matsutake 945]